MTAFTIVASKDGRTVTTVRIEPTITVIKAQALWDERWQVHITDADGWQYQSDQFYLLLDPYETDDDPPST